MYPLNTKAPWPENQWYIAGFGQEVGQALLGRTFLNKRVVMFRDEAGTVRALAGVCPHRMMPMDAGKLKGDTLECAYHGLTFDTEGKCVAAPTSSTLPNCALASYPIREVGPLLWIWMGDPALAERTPLPEQESIGIGAEGWHTELVDYYQLKARYLLLVDNLFDLSHIGFVHASILGEGGIALVEPKIEERDGRLLVTRVLPGVPTDDYHRFLHPGVGEVMTATITSDLLGVSLINAGGPAYNGPSVESPVLGEQNFIHAITPETEHSTNYWILMTRDFRRDDPGLDAALSAQNRAVVNQDRDALEAIETMLQTGVELPREISMKPDAGALRARLRVMQMIRAEQETEVAA
jgi:vanillate O-demethylase monooxygenase subunit